MGLQCMRSKGLQSGFTVCTAEMVYGMSRTWGRGGGGERGGEGGGRGVGTQQVGRGGWWNNKNILHNKEGRLISNNLE